MPAGTDTMSFRVFVSRPLPRHCVHCLAMILPSPRQVPQVATWVNWPKMLWCDRRTCPVPLQAVHVAGVAPGSLRSPLHLEHVSLRRSSTGFSTPKTDSSKLTVSR